MFDGVEQLLVELQREEPDRDLILRTVLGAGGRDGLCAGRTISPEAVMFESPRGRREYDLPEALRKTRWILALLGHSLGVEPNGGPEEFTTWSEGRRLKLTVEIVNSAQEASFAIRRLEWLPEGADCMGRMALTARRLLGDAEGLCVVDWHIATAPDSRYFIARRRGRGGELVQRVYGRERRLAMSSKSLESLLTKLKAAGLFELQDGPEEEREGMLDGQVLAVALRWGAERRSHEVDDPSSPHPGLAAVGELMNASPFRLRIKCLLGRW
ncbi:hypothetical protein ACLESD_00310 [Pyxidicoccus sp. 3LFB2]